MDLVSEAIIFAAKAHDGMTRKMSGAPYVLHPMEAAVIVGTMTDDHEIIAAAALHDVVEDAGIDIEKIEEMFGHRVRTLVGAETENKRAELPPESTWRVRKEETLEALAKTDDISVLMLWIGDKLANIRSIYRSWKLLGDNVWGAFNQKDREEQAWYYRTVAELTKEISYTSAWIEYNTLTELIFKKDDVK